MTSGMNEKKKITPELTDCLKSKEVEGKHCYQDEDDYPTESYTVR